MTSEDQTSNVNGFLRNLEPLLVRSLPGYCPSLHHHHSSPSVPPSRLPQWIELQHTAVSAMNETAPDPPSLAINLHSSGARPPLQNGDSDSLRSLCTSLHSQITAFLQEDVQTETLRAVQAQTKKSLAIIQRALDRYS